MFPESAKSGPEGDHRPSATGGRSALDREVRDMVNAITHRFSRLEGAHHHREPEEEDDQHGVRIVTLAGSNMGATMRSELLGNKKSSAPANSARRGGDEDEDEDDDDDDEDEDDDDDEEAGTFVNSNFQAVNNSIMMSSNYNTNDPGVHLDISDVFGPPRPHHYGLGTEKPAMRKQLWKRKDKAALPTEPLYSDARSD